MVIDRLKFAVTLFLLAVGLINGFARVPDRAITHFARHYTSTPLYSTIAGESHYLSTFAPFHMNIEC